MAGGPLGLGILGGGKRDAAELSKFAKALVA